MQSGVQKWLAVAVVVAIAASVLIFRPFGASGGEVTLHTSQGAHRLTVEIADTPQARARGLMYRERLDAGQGMLFLYPAPRRVTMWMKNTVIPLDMLFINGDGRIVRVARNAQPHSLTIIPSGEPVIAVLEIAGGRAAELNVAAGDRLESSVSLDSAKQ